MSSVEELTDKCRYLKKKVEEKKNRKAELLAEKKASQKRLDELKEQSKEKFDVDVENLPSEIEKLVKEAEESLKKAEEMMEDDS